jgi:hypothetical protein
MTPCILVDLNPIFKENCCSHYHLLMDGAKCHVTEGNGIVSSPCTQQPASGPSRSLMASPHILRTNSCIMVFVLSLHLHARTHKHTFSLSKKHSGCRFYRQNICTNFWILQCLLHSLPILSTYLIVPVTAQTAGLVTKWFPLSAAVPFSLGPIPLTLHSWTPSIPVLPRVQHGTYCKWRRYRLETCSLCRQHLFLSLPNIRLTTWIGTS